MSSKVPITATPTLPPTFLNRLKTPEPTPSLSFGSVPITPFVSGDIVRANPTPIIIKPIAIYGYDVRSSSSLKENNAQVIIAIPSDAGILAPYLPANLPPSGASKIKDNVSGSIDRPALIAVNP
ncbi:hypothetical protein SDC9_162962 [bioreactor metagenome]|uniref:Uncharacterized protein n=1 Tax=bioreactor metagenome TaxID=1076179 RepID=A0A645FMJ0_9ZZZZ